MLRQEDFEGLKHKETTHRIRAYRFMDVCGLLYLRLSAGSFEATAYLLSVIHV